MMRISDLKRLDEAPKAGMMLAYTRAKVWFQAYSFLEEVKELLQDDNLLEMHLFDKEKEYRCLQSESARYSKQHGIIETIRNSKEEDKQSIYCEQCLLLKGGENHDNGGSVTVINHIAYDENGMAYFDNYRLSMD